MPVTNALVAKPGSKRALLLALLSRQEGATVEALMQAMGWLPHTTRAALSVLRKGGIAIARSRDEDESTSVYRIAGATSSAFAFRMFNLAAPPAHHQHTAEDRSARADRTDRDNP